MINKGTVCLHRGMVCTETWRDIVEQLDESPPKIEIRVPKIRRQAIASQYNAAGWFCPHKAQCLTSNVITSTSSVQDECMKQSNINPSFPSAGLFLLFTSISPLAERPLDASSWSSVPMLYPRLLRISVSSVPESLDSGSPDPVSTVSSPSSCAREVISPTTTVPEVCMRI